MRGPFIPAAISVVSFLAAPVIANEVVIDNAPFDDVQTPVVLPLVAIRPMSNLNPGYASALPRLQVSDDLIIDSAFQFDDVRDQLLDTGKEHSDLTIADVVNALNVSGFTEKCLYGSEESYLYCPAAAKVVESSIASSGGFQYWDAGTLLNMVATGVVNTDEIQHVNVEGTAFDMVGIDQDYSDSLAQIYSDLSFLNKAEVTEQGMIFASLKDNVRQYTPLQQSLLQNVGEITFGYPIAYRSDERNLIIPESIRENFDVYWLDLAITFRKMNSDLLIEMAVNFALPEGGIALEIVPLQYGNVITSKTELNSPELSVEYKGARVSVGEIFGTSVSYTYLRPTIVGYGLRERRFSWIIKDEAVRAGSHKFVAIVGLPKGSDNLDLAMSGHVRLKASWLGEWFDGELLAGTDTLVVPISF